MTAEFALANQVYAMELDNAPGQRVSAIRKAAWAIEDLARMWGWCTDS